MLRPRPSHMMMSRGLANFTVAASPTSVSGSATIGSGATTNSTTVTQQTGPASALTYVWTVLSGPAGLTITSATSATTTFSATTASGTKNWVVRCTATNSFGQTAVADVNVAVTGTNPPFSASVVLAQGGNAGGAIQHIPGGQGYSDPATCTPANGAPPYTYNWSAPIGGSTCSGTASTSTLNISGQPSGTTRTYWANCTVHDVNGQSTLAQDSVTIIWT